MNDHKRVRALHKEALRIERTYGEPAWRSHFRLGNLMRFGAFWVVLGAILRFAFA